MLCAKQMAPEFDESHSDTSPPIYTRHFPI